MTTSPVMNITDELVAELEFDLEVAETTHQLEASVSREALAALLAERAELKRDAERYRFWRYMATHEPAKMARTLAYYETTGQLDAAIDAAMQSKAKP